jgi:three-Cys-motif partner protein
MQDQELYERREQTLVKHYILRHYLKRFAHIVAHKWRSITYIDCFAGPWNARSPDLRDSSFSIALDELRNARNTHGQSGRKIELRCCFLEQNREAYSQLRAFADGVTDAEVCALNGRFEDSVTQIVDFVRARRETFPFVFIDPTGWNGFALNTISPLLRLNPGEILVNFMTGHIRRFLRDENSQQSFIRLFGSADFKAQVASLSGLALEDAAVSEYIRSLRREGRYQYVLPAVVLHPEIDRTHFHLIYATHHPKGVEVFKEIEKRAMAQMEQVRAAAQSRRREERTGQGSLFGTDEAPEGAYYNDLRGHYLRDSRERVLNLLRRSGWAAYDDVWACALGSPLVWEADLKDWIEEWRHAGELRLEGLQGGDRVPKRGRSHCLRWLGQVDRATSST